MSSRPSRRALFIKFLASCGVRIFEMSKVVLGRAAQPNPLPADGSGGVGFVACGWFSYLWPNPSPAEWFGICGRACNLRLKTSTSGRGTNIVENSYLGSSMGFSVR
jgi:hypothetical protein